MTLSPFCGKCLRAHILPRLMASIGPGNYFPIPTGRSSLHWCRPRRYSESSGYIADRYKRKTDELDLRIRYMNATTAEASPNLAIAVPSRLYYSSTSERPLEGLRVAVKDNIDIAGIKTFASSRSYGELYGSSAQSAPVIQQLVQLGAVVVGKTSMSQFADAEDPTGDFVEFHSPQNPRGDGNRNPGGSSFGSGAAAGAYDWIDFIIGTDSRLPLNVFPLRNIANSF